MKKAAVIIAIVFSVFWGIWLIAVPEALVVRLIENSLKKSGIEIKAEGVEKGLFYSLRAESINLTGENNVPIVTMKDVEAGIDFTSFVKLTVGVDFHGDVDKGKIKGNIGLVGADVVSEIEGSGISIQNLSILERRFGIYGTGRLSFHFRRMKNNRQEIKFSIDDAKIRGSGLLPLEMFQKGQGTLVMDRGVSSVKNLSLSLEGKGIYARVRGNIGGKSQKFKMEVMVDSSSQSEPSPLKIIERFKVSPGYYVLPFSLP